MNEQEPKDRISIAIFENEYIQLSGTFEMYNLIDFNNTLKFDIFESSQKFGSLNALVNYNLIIIDLDLSIASRLDGYQIIEFLIKTGQGHKIIILTGHLFIDEQLKSKGLPALPVITKPISIPKLREVISPKLLNLT